MGCAQTPPRVTPSNQSSTVRLYDNRNYPVGIGPPPPTIIVSRRPSYAGSILSNSGLNGRKRSDTLPFTAQKTQRFNKSVKFDEKVLVMARTPTPDKIWYEKASTTMPMRQHPRDDNNDHDYDDDESPLISTDEEQENNQLFDTTKELPKLGGPTLVVPRNQLDSFWLNNSNNNKVGISSSTNTKRENEPFPVAAPPLAINRNKQPTGVPVVSTVSRIKVRRKLPNLGPPQISLNPSHQSTVHVSTVPSNQIPAPTVAFVPHQPPVQPAIVSTQQTPVQPPTNVSVQASSQPPSVASSQPTM